VEILSVHIC